ncbi:MAG: ECF transporter S component [Oscillospiraceae bacterium]|nr:ECF transporter S component [Oscillospiraceae bacterium]
MRKTGINVGKMVQLAVLVAIIVVLAVTQIGFIMLGPLSITIMMIPVAIAAIVVGPAGGAIAGGVFGLTAFIRGISGVSLFAATLININPIYAFILFVVARVLAGWIPGLIYKALSAKKNKTLSATVACFVAPICNTVFFLSTLFLLFGNTEYIRGFGDTAWAIIMTLAGINAVVEAGVGFIVGTAISRALVHFLPGKKPEMSNEAKVSV